MTSRRISRGWLPIVVIPLIIAFIILAAFTYTSGLRAPALIAIVKDVAGINWSRFGGNEGIWRLARILEDTGTPATLFCNGRSAELWPQAVAAFAACAGRPETLLDLIPAPDGSRDLIQSGCRRSGVIEPGPIATCSAQADRATASTPRTT